jgi:hypothetical protein
MARGSEPAFHVHGSSPERLLAGTDIGGWESLKGAAARFLPERYRFGLEQDGAWDPADQPSWFLNDLLMVRDFLDSVLEDRPLDVGIHRALDMTLPGIFAEGSISRGGGWVDVPNSRFFTAGIGI